MPVDGRDQIKSEELTRDTVRFLGNDPEYILREMLAIIHGDGGQVTCFVGLPASAAIAIRKLYMWMELEAQEIMRV